MTSNEPPLPIGNRVFSRPSCTLSQTFQQTPRSWPYQAPNQTSNAPANPQDVSEPAYKKQKLDDTARSLGRKSGKDTADFSSNPTTSAKVLMPVDVPDGQIEQDGKENEHRVRQRPLLPHRPIRDSYTSAIRHGRASVVERAPRRDVVQIRPYIPEPPACAPRFGDAGPADFFPWAGKHPEDALNELTTKSGFFDKLQGSQTETTTARPSVLSSLKHKSGIQILASVFISALDQRRVHGTITAASTFKPPPRVTLTDTKREAWLRDLANPSIPLRRLSRTIPHGIRGKILLEHCLSKDIPTSRAIWLAKCVGANEIRAFKRKGPGGMFTIGGEAKWIKDWTISVEQFLEAIVISCGTPEWRSRVNYGLHLTSHLFSEHLLDRDLYLSWIVRSLRDCDLDSLPIWLLVTKIYLQEVLQYRHHGRLLVEAIFDHLRRASQLFDQEPYGSVVQQITLFVKAIMRLAPGCFLLSGCWEEHVEAVRNCLRDDDPQLQSCFAILSKRNMKLRKRSQRQEGRPRSTCREQLINLLDRLSSERNYGRTAAACLRLNSSHGLLVRTCIEWSASAYRHGQFRTYAAARLLRIWNKLGVQLQEPILDFLNARADPVGFKRRDIYRLLAELVSSKHLSVGKYLQWLMARGTLQGRQQPLQVASYDVEFLFELPLQGLPNHIINLRQTLLSSLGVRPEHESNIINIVKANLTDHVANFFPADNATRSPTTLDINYVTLSQTVKAAIARWIRQNLMLRLQSCNTDCSDTENYDRSLSDSFASHSVIITLDQFQSLCAVYEDIGDFAVLADILVLLSTEVRGSVLTAVADTANHYYDVFEAIGAAENIFGNLCRQQEVASGQEHTEKSFLESLVDLGYRLPGSARDMARLRKRLSAYTSKPSPAVYSPISDTMVEAVQSAEPAFADEMDQMLSSGTMMDQPTLSRTFARIAAHLELSLGEPDCPVIRFSQLLVRLRSFGSKTFDILLLEWLQSWLQANPRPNLALLLPPMICSRIISLKVVINAVVRCLSVEGSHKHKVMLALDTVDLLTEAHSERMVIVDYRRYRMLDQLHNLERTSATLLLSIVRVVIEGCTTTDPVTRFQAQRRIKSNGVGSLIRSILLQHHWTQKAAKEALVPTLFSIGTLNVIGGLLHEEHEGPPDTGLSTKFLRLLDDMNDFNIPMAQVELKTVLAFATESSENAMQILSEILIERAGTPAAGSIELWTHLVSKLTMTQAASVREKAETELLSRAARNMTSILSEDRIGALEAIVEAAAFSVPDKETSPILEQISDSLSNLVASPQLEKHHTENAETDPLSQYIDVILRLLVIHQRTIQHSMFSQNTLYHILISLALLLIHPFLAFHPNLTNQLCDVLSLLSDCLSVDTRSRCIRALRDHHQTKDPRLRFIFGYPETVEKESLQLVTKSTSPSDGRGESAAATTSTKSFALRRWEMMQDATPVGTENDTSLSLTLFGARKSIL